MVPVQMVQLTVICANISGLLYELSVAGVGLHHVDQTDELNVAFCVRQSQYQQTIKIVEQFGGKIVKSVYASGSILIKCFIRRPMLVLGMALLLLLTFYLPTRVLFVTVSGNERLPQRQIMDAASDCGIRFGAVRQRVRSEQVKNQLLSVLPELKWVGVNTRGCVAHISVQERALPQVNEKEPMVSSLVATSDGIIREITVTSGNPVCRVGQAVKKGQVLVSGYTDCGRCIYGTRSSGEIYAQTRRIAGAIALTKGIQKEPDGTLSKKYGFFVGKKRINFYKGSGISDATCVRMYREYPLTLPGGFQLPIGLTVQREVKCDVVTMQVDCADSERILQRCTQMYLESQMIAGKIEQANGQFIKSEGALRWVGQYCCDEMIGQARSEEIAENYGQAN